VPEVDGKKYPYTKKGRLAARNARKRKLGSKTRSNYVIKKRNTTGAPTIGGTVGFLAGRKAKDRLTPDEKRRRALAAAKRRAKNKAEGK
jgi:hypothetical protein